MRFDRVRMENFKCYGDADLRLERGVTVIHGLNGSGKSSLLEACFFALYGSKALDDRNLDEVVTIGAEEATVELWFHHAGGDYHVERRVKVREDRAQTTKCVLETPDETVEGARAVRATVTDLLRMDAEAFVNCAYVRQGEVNKLINASPRERQDMIDDLLQLGKLEEYRERSSDARLGVKHVRDDKHGALSQLDDQITEKEDADLHDQLNALKSDLAEVEGEIERIDGKREQAVETRDHEREVIEEAEERQQEIASLSEAVEELEESIAATERERTEKRERVGDLRERVREHREERDDVLAGTDLDDADPETVEARVEELEARDDDLLEELQDEQLTAQEQKNRAETLDEQAADLEARAAEAREDAADLAGDVEAATEKVEEGRERLDDLDEEIAEKRERFADAPCDREEVDAHRESVAEEVSALRERTASLEADLENAREAVAEAERLREEGKCPECGQPVGGSPHVEAIEERRERVAELEAELESVGEELADAEERHERAEALVALAGDLDDLESRRESVEQLVEERERGIESDRERVAELRETAEELDAEAAEKREAAARSGPFRLPELVFLRERIARTGRSVSPWRLIGACGAASAILALILVGVLGQPVGLAVPLGLVVGLGVPYLALGMLAKRRLNRFVNMMPEAIDVIVRGVRSGLPVTEAMAHVGREMDDPIATEFRRIIDSYRLGRPLGQAMADTARRLNVAEFNFLVVALTIQQETGGNLAETLANLADIIRKRRQLRLKVKALTGEAKSSAAVVGSLPFLLFLVINYMNPEYTSFFFNDPRGMMMLGAGLGSMVIGMAIMYKIANFEI